MFAGRRAHARSAVLEALELFREVDSLFVSCHA
jgi:hypothetical protein